MYDPRSKVIRRVLTARYPRLYVDEYQDLAPGLDRLVRPLCFDYAVNAELFAVGDPDQAVFGWTGTRPGLLAELAQRSDVTAVRLDHNYRCGAEIIRFANRMRQGEHEIHGSRDQADRIEVTTMTSSKGLEFDVVLILGLDEKRVPDFRSETDPEKLQEDRRKFYVSVTRARDEVRIFYSGFVEWASGRQSNAGPSRFLREIGLLRP
jgi:superfamily I DNA/RNA helicase